jgi:hypothetical protein
LGEAKLLSLQVPVENQETPDAYARLFRDELKEKLVGMGIAFE